MAKEERIAELKVLLEGLPPSKLDAILSILRDESARNEFDSESYPERCQTKQ